MREHIPLFNMNSMCLFSLYSTLVLQKITGRWEMLKYTTKEDRGKIIQGRGDTKFENW